MAELIVELKKFKKTEKANKPKGEMEETGEHNDNDNL